MEEKRCTLVNNSDRENAKVVVLKSSAGKSDLLKLATEKFDFKVKKLFLEGGGEIDDISIIRDNDVIYVSGGEAFANKISTDSFPQYSLTVMGPTSVGKSAMTMQFVQGVFIRDHDPTIEDAFRKNTTIDAQPCMLDILDTAGQEDYSVLRSTWMQKRDGFMFVFSVADRDTFNELDSFYDQLLAIHEENMPPLLLVGNKCDLESKRQVSSQEGQRMGEKYQCNYIETSAKTGKNVDDAFLAITREVRKRLDPHDSKPSKKKKFFCSIL